MKKLNGLKEIMQEHCSRIYCNVDDIFDNVMFMAAKLNEQDISKELEMQARNLLGELIWSSTILINLSFDLGKKFDFYIVNLDREKVNLPEYEVKELIQILGNIVNEQFKKIDDFVRFIDKKYKNKEVNGLMTTLFYESGGNIDRCKTDIENSLKIIFYDYDKYEYEINNQNTTSN